MLQIRSWIGIAVVMALCIGFQPSYAAKKLEGQTVFYNPQYVVFESDFLQAGNRELMIRFGAREKQLIAQIDKLRADVKEFQDKSPKMQAKKRDQEAKALEKRDVELQKQRNALIQESNVFKQFLDVEMTKMLREACQELSKDTGCTAVLDTGRTSVVYLAPEVDVTQVLRKKVDEKWAKKKGKFVFPK